MAQTSVQTLLELPSYPVASTAVPQPEAAYQFQAPPDTSDDSCIARIIASEPSVMPAPAPGAATMAVASSSPAQVQPGTPTFSNSPFLTASMEFDAAHEAALDEYTKSNSNEGGLEKVGSLIYPEFIRDRSRDISINRQLSTAPSSKLLPRINAAVPENISSDRERLLLRLDMYNLTEKIVKGDGACQFRSLSDQLYGTPEHPVEVRQAIVTQLLQDRDRYACYVPTDYSTYVDDMSKHSTWGDHVTLQAAADKFGCRINVLTSYKENCVISIESASPKNDRVLWLSFWAEVHYNSLLSKEDVERGALQNASTRAIAAQAKADSKPEGEHTSSSKVLGSRKLGKAIKKTFGLGHHH